jgi:hypothetical protein
VGLHAFDRINLLPELGIELGTSFSRCSGVVIVVLLLVLFITVITVVVVVLLLVIFITVVPASSFTGRLQNRSA